MNGDTDRDTAQDADACPRRLTINDIARLAGVSKKTVSRVINESRFVADETRARVAAVIAQHGYEPDPQARGLAFRRSFLIGFVYNNPNPQYIVNAQQGILDALIGTGFEMVVRPARQTAPEFLSEMRSFVERQKLAGVITFPSVAEDERLAALLRELGCPYVRVAAVALDKNDHMVVTHDREGAKAVAKHLAGLGHRRIAYISGPPEFRSSRERREGFEAGLAEAGLTLSPADVAVGGYTYETGLQAARQLLAAAPRPTAIFAGNDEMAVGVYRAAHELNLRIPEDLSVVGFDDSPIAARIWPPLTSVRAPIRDIGRMAGELLLAQHGVEIKTPHVELWPAVTQRESSAPV